MVCWFGRNQPTNIYFLTWSPGGFNSQCDIAYVSKLAKTKPTYHNKADLEYNAGPTSCPPDVTSECLSPTQTKPMIDPSECSHCQLLFYKLEATGGSTQCTPALPSTLPRLEMKVQFNENIDSMCGWSCCYLMLCDYSVIISRNIKWNELNHSPGSWIQLLFNDWDWRLQNEIGGVTTIITYLLWSGVWWMLELTLVLWEQQPQILFRQSFTDVSPAQQWDWLGLSWSVWEC